MESPTRNAFALGFSLLIASFIRVTETKTLFGLRFGPPLATAEVGENNITIPLSQHLPGIHIYNCVENLTLITVRFI